MPVIPMEKQNLKGLDKEPLDWERSLSLSLPSPTFKDCYRDWLRPVGKPFTNTLSFITTTCNFRKRAGFRFRDVSIERHLEIHTV